MQTGRLALVMMALCVCAGCTKGSQSGTCTPPSSSSDPAVSTSVASVSATSQLSEMVKWSMTNKTRQPQLVTCEVLVLDRSTQLGDYGPVQLAVAAGATAEEFSEVSTLAGNSAGDTAQIVCQRD